MVLISAGVLLGWWFILFECHSLDGNFSCGTCSTCFKRSRLLTAGNGVSLVHSDEKCWTLRTASSNRITQIDFIYSFSHLSNICVVIYEALKMISRRMKVMTRTRCKSMGDILLDHLWHLKFCVIQLNYWAILDWNSSITTTGAPCLGFWIDWFSRDGNFHLCNNTDDHSSQL